MGIIVHRGGLPSPGTSLDSTGAASDCTSYARLYPADSGVKAYERATYGHEPKSTYDHLTRPGIWMNEAAKYPADHPNKTYDAKSYAEAKCHEVVKYHHEIVNSKYHEMTAGGTRYPELQSKSYELPKYPETKGYSSEMSGAATKAPYACVHGQYYPTAEGHAVHEENDYHQAQSVSSHSFYPYISASMAQPPYYMGPR